MIKSLDLKNFKNFADARAEFGPFTVLVGANGSGKSNLIEALRVMKGIASNIDFPELFDGVHGSDGRTWRGIRGGAESAFRVVGSNFLLMLEMHYDLGRVEVRCEMDASNGGRLKRIYTARSIEGGTFEFTSQDFSKRTEMVSSNISVDHESDEYIAADQIRHICEGDLENVFFEDFDERAMRGYANLRQKQIWETGENLSAALAHTIENNMSERAAIEWLRTLLESEAKQIGIERTAAGDALLYFVDDQDIRRYSQVLSDGTLYFLAVFTAIWGARSGSIFVFEELASRVHPSRVHHLVNLIEACVAEQKIQVIATTHSPQVLSALSPRALDDVLVFGKTPDHEGTIIRRAGDIPHFHDVLKRKGIEFLFKTDWMGRAL